MNYLLVHGAYHGSWCWDEMSEALERKGHKVFSVTLPGHGDSLKKEIYLKDYVDYLLKYIFNNELDDLILVGHSFGCVVTSHVATFVPHRVKKLVLVAGVVIGKNQRFSDLLPESIQNKYKNIKGNYIPLNKEYAFNIFFNSDKLYLNHIDKLVSQPKGPYFDLAYMGDLDNGDFEIIYIQGSEDKAVSSEMLGNVKNNLPDKTKWLEIKSGHEIMITSSEDLVRYIGY